MSEELAGFSNYNFDKNKFCNSRSLCTKDDSKQQTYELVQEKKVTQKKLMCTRLSLLKKMSTIQNVLNMKILPVGTIPILKSFSILFKRHSNIKISKIEKSLEHSKSETY